MPRHSPDERTSLVLAELERVTLEREPDHTIAVVLRSAQELDAPMTVTAIAGGLTRTRAYALLERTAESRAPVPQRTLRRVAGAALGRPLGLVGHADAIGVDIGDLRRALCRLGERGAAEVLVKTSDVSGQHITEEFWIPGPAHEEWVRNELDALRWVRSERFAVYIELPPDTRDKVAGAAWDLLPDLAGVLKAGTTSAATWDELAVAVKAEDSREAISEARGLWNEICARTGLDPSFFVVRELIPPTQPSVSA